MEVDEDLKTLLSAQSHELRAAQAVESDLYFAYQLQVQEAISASLPENGSAPSSSNPVFPVEETSTDDAIPVFADEISAYEQHLLDQSVAEDEMKKIREDLNRRVHDHAFARELLAVPDAEWRNIGDNIEKPYTYTEGSSSYSGGVVWGNVESYRVHVKGLMDDGTVGKGQRNTFVGGIGVAVCDMNDVLVFEVSKGVVGGEINGEVVEVKALVEGLHVATTLGLRRVLIICDSDFMHRCFAGKWRPTQGNHATLVNQISLLSRNLTHCSLFLVAQKDVKFAFKLAQDAIVSQLGQLAGNYTGGKKKAIETCAICLEDINVNRMFPIEGCSHRFCFSCMRRHVEVQLLEGLLPRCPQEQCKCQLKTDDCKKFLTAELFENMNQRIMENSIPAADKVYCPYPSCSALMSRSEFMHGGRLPSVMIMCRKCNHPFCIACKVIWHYNMTCSMYKIRNPNPSREEAELKSLATRSRWRQCKVCNFVVSLGEGCNHIYCRCGYEFCYICGAAWVNKKATCKCPLWDERNIVYER